MNVWMDKLIYGCVNELIDGLLDGLMDVLMDRWTSG